VKAECRFTEDDYVKGMQFHAWRQSIGKPTLMAARAITAILVLGAWWTSRDTAPMFALSLMILALVILVMLPALQMYILVPYSARRMYRQYKAIQEPLTYELSEDGLLISSVEGEMTLLWRMILRWRQNDQFVLIYKMPVLFYVVPKSLAQQGFDIPLLVQRLAERVGKES
jgi:hypothetical protein